MDSLDIHHFYQINVQYNERKVGRYLRVIRRCKLKKEGQYNKSMRKNEKITKNGRQNITWKTKH